MSSFECIYFLFEVWVLESLPLSIEALDIDFDFCDIMSNDRSSLVIGYRLKMLPTQSSGQVCSLGARDRLKHCYSIKSWLRLNAARDRSMHRKIEGKLRVTPLTSWSFLRNMIMCQGPLFDINISISFHLLFSFIWRNNIYFEINLNALQMTLEN